MVKKNNTNATPIMHIKIFYKTKNVSAFLFFKNIVVYYINIYVPVTAPGAL